MEQFSHCLLFWCNCAHTWKSLPPPVQSINAVLLMPANTSNFVVELIWVYLGEMFHFYCKESWFEPTQSIEHFLARYKNLLDHFWGFSSSGYKGSSSDISVSVSVPENWWCSGDDISESCGSSSIWRSISSSLSTLGSSTLHWTGLEEHSDMVSGKSYKCYVYYCILLFFIRQRKAVISKPCCCLILMFLLYQLFCFGAGGFDCSQTCSLDTLTGNILKLTKSCDEVLKHTLW